MVSRLDSSAVQLRPALFPISAVRHVRLLLGWCDAGSGAPITEETRLEGALFPARYQRPGHLAVFCSITAFRAIPTLSIPLPRFYSCQEVLLRTSEYGDRRARRIGAGWRQDEACATD